MKTRMIGSRAIGEIGLGCMNLSHAYGIPPSAESAKRLIVHAVELGVKLLDTAALYGFGKNESLLGEIMPNIRDRIFLASKCGITGVEGRRVIDGRPKTLVRTLDEALTRLRTDFIDLYYLHRWDRSIPIEESIGALGRMVTAGKVRNIGLSEVSVATLRRAHSEHPIAAVQSEYSLWTRNPEIGVLEECRRLGIAFVAFSPLGRGFLAGGVTDPARLLVRDLRRGMPRFQEPHWERNAALLGALRALAQEVGHTPAQLSLAWLLQKAPHIIPIPGTTAIDHLEENVDASNITLEDRVVSRLESILNERTVSGRRYPLDTLAEIDSDEFSSP